MAAVFDMAEFTAKLPSNATRKGLMGGEFVFSIPLDPQVELHVYSTLIPGGLSGGMHPIRLFLVSPQWGAVDMLATVVSPEGAWDTQLQSEIARLTKLRSLAGDCRTCNKPKKIWKAGGGSKPENVGRLYAKCPDGCDASWQWLDAPTIAPYFKGSVQTETTAPAVSGGEAEDGFFDLVTEVVEPAPVDDRQPDADQRLVIDAPLMPIRVLAGPGAGKTFTLAHRYRHMVRDLGIDPNSIVSITFTSKMAGELLSKILALTPEIKGQPAEQQICTGHALCNRFLREYYPEIKKLTVPEREKKYIPKKIIQELLQKYVKDAEDRPAWEETMDAINRAKAFGYDSLHDPMFFQAYGDYAELLTIVRRDFDARMRSEGLWMYSDMPLEMQLRLKNDKSFKGWCQSRIKHIMTDEAQDNNGQFMDIYHMLVDHTRSFMEVGDQDQLLYRFTGATPEENLMEGFERLYPEGRMFMMGINYRSDQEIVKRALQLIQRNYANSGGPYEQRYLKPLRPFSSNLGVPIHLSIYEDPMDEARGVLREVQSYIVHGGKPADIFIGMRTRAQAGYLESIFSRANPSVPYINTTGISFWGLQHIQMVINYLDLAVHPDNSEAFKRCMNVPSGAWRMGWGDDKGKYVNTRFLSTAFFEMTKGSMRNVHQVARDNFKFRAAAADLEDLVSEIQQTLQTAGESELGAVGEAVNLIINYVVKPYLLYESGSTDEGVGDSARVDDLSTVAEVAATFAGQTPQSFLEFVAKMVAQAKAQENARWENYVVFSTVHGLKGMERPIVYGLGISVSDPSILNNPVSGLLPHTFSMIPPPNRGKLKSNGMGRMEDERDIFFVLLTRAKKEVFFSSIRKYRKSIMMPSPFLAEIDLVPERKTESYDEISVDSYEEDGEG